LLQFVAKCVRVSLYEEIKGENSMAASIRLASSLIEEAKRYASNCFRSPAKQIEYWAYLGKMVDQNQELPVDFIKGCLEAKAEVEAGEVSNFEFVSE
jgi:hypothetical protein